MSHEFTGLLSAWREPQEDHDKYLRDEEHDAGHGSHHAFPLPSQVRSLPSDSLRLCPVFPATGEP